MTTTTISDTRIRVRPSKHLLKTLDAHKKKFKEVPEGIAKALTAHGYKIPSFVEILSDPKTKPKRGIINASLLKDLINGIPSISQHSSTASNKTKEPADTDIKANVKSTTEEKSASYLYLTDLYWLNDFLTELRHAHGSEVFLHELLETCELILPENEIIPRNPELEARCRRLRAQQENFEYQKMTKNVDSTRQKYPEDTISYQIKAINKQLVAVFQFVVSVITGFVFGFWGLQLIVGNLQFGFRLILGIIFSLVIALAEMYFLAVKLNEYDNAVDAQNPKIAESSKVKSKKAHID